MQVEAKKWYIIEQILHIDNDAGLDAVQTVMSEREIQPIHRTSFKDFEEYGRKKKLKK